jgi:hypothetical protein
MSRLRAVSAVLRTSAALDVQEHAALDLVRRVVLAVYELGAKQQIEQRRLVDGGYLGDRPVVANGGVSHRPQTNTKVIPNALTFTMEIHGGPWRTSGLAPKP